ncbi:DUF4082 domain-containing protein [Agromyces sp. NPDC058136]|uniref:DUF4082 domain-containing protein n=1 Tax=Agromyces sp. NPDC058136 TaxID=3346354 RepID=UPI0036DF108B
MITRTPAPPAPRPNPHPRRRLVSMAILPVLLASLGVTVATQAVAAECANPIVCENALPGTDPSVWDIDGAGDSSIQGFATDISVTVGNRIDFKIDTTARNYTIDIYRTGWYQGLGARKITSVTPSATLPQRQPQCITDVKTELVDCGNWGVSASWNVPATAVSGVYLAHLTRTDTGGQSHIMFVVRNPASTAKILFQTSDTTWQAYNSYGGSDFYTGGANGRAYKISYNRPIVTRDGITRRDFYFSSEFAMVRFLERNGYDTTYASGVDTDRYGAELLDHKIFLSVGHDEYWSGAQRANVQKARDAGVNIQFLGGNDIYWRTRYEKSADPSATPYRTLVSYKETWSYQKIDPSPEWTGTWRDPEYAPASAGGNSPENSLIGTMYMVNHDDLAVTVSAAEGKNRLWRNTSLASLPANGSAALAPHTVGYESNEDVDNGRRPPGLIRLSTTVGDVPEYLEDFGNTVSPGRTEHHLTLYRAASGALVFSAGTVQWAWGLDATHDGNGAPADSRMQQAQVNLLADMGALPATLQPGLAATTPSTDATPPTLAITSPSSGTPVVNGQTVTLTGTAADVGGVVAGVEVSTDGGTTWRPATGRASWSYTFTAHGMGAVPVLARAIDDSANFPAQATQITLQTSGPYSAFGAEKPKLADSGGTDATELGMRFSPTVAGAVSGVRFYKSAGNTGTHTGSLWGPGGTLLATGTFTGETASGWQELRFENPVPVDVDTTYTVSYWAPRGHYAADAYAFAAGGMTRDPISLPGGFGVTPAGVYGGAGQMPVSSWKYSNYFVDVIFETGDVSPLSATSRWPAPGATDVPTTTVVSATFTKPVTTYSAAVTDQLGATVAGATAYDAATRTLTFTPSAPLQNFVEYTVRLTASTSTGTPLSSGATWTFRTVRPDPADAVCPCRLFSDSTTPGILQDPDNSNLVLGTAFKPVIDGTVSGMAFYKAAGNTGTHTGSLWTSTGTLLTSGTFTNESASGWQKLTFANPVAVKAGTEYVISYRAPNGRYSATVGAFAQPIDAGPLTIPASAGAFAYSGDFPASRTTTSYLVDVVFDRGSPRLAVTATSPPENATNVAPDSNISVTFNGEIAAGATLSATAGGTAVAGSLSLSADRRVLTFDPTGMLPAGATVTVSSKNVASQGSMGTLADRQWSFTVAAAAPTGEFSLFTGQTPAVAAASDSASIELGMAFTASTNGKARGVRFYKGTGNTGTHVGSLWDATTGQKLASATFQNETTTGWQQTLFATPVDLVAGRLYVVSYLAPKGRYSYTQGVFTSAVTNGPLTAIADTNGRYRYGTGGQIPSFGWNQTNYFVDVVFRNSVDQPIPATVTSTTPAGNATGVDPRTTVTAVLSGQIAATPQLALKGPAGAVVQGTSSWNAQSSTLTFTPASALAAATSYQATVTISGAAVDNGTWSFVTAAAAQAGPVFFGSATPTNTSWDDAGTVQLGLRFRSSAAVTVSGIRFYKVSGDAATHQVFLWGADTSAPVATATSSGESASGWQTVLFASPVQLVPGTEYRASFLTTRGRYAADVGTLDDPIQVGPLSTIADGGTYTYGGAIYPAAVAPHNFWVDIVLTG